MNITLEDYKTMLAHHDWYYAFSDDHRVYCAGEESANKIFNLAKYGDDDFKRAYNEMSKRYFDTPSFSNWKPTFKNV
jgi:hypothetical protein